ncbi:MAG: histidine--tRNA ligase, partial [Ruminococcus sp.]
MAINIKRPNGTEDILPSEIHKWLTVEKIARETAETYGFNEIRIPTFENTNLFLRSVGETTDVVQKEMYTVMAKETKFTLRPEGTAGSIRAMLQNGLLNEALPQKVFYILSCFRHERPQAGRLREFHQFGVEMAGTSSPCADAEVISLAKTILDRLELKNIELYINSIGCPECRAEYHKALREYFSSREEELCDTCRSRLERNPMRILDCKSPVCSDIAKDAPLIIDFLCDECKDHFEKLKEYLTVLGIEYKINPKIVRGLDYYTKTVFEFVTTEIGAQGTVCGGGRYDGLIEELGGKHVPALGFAMGIERLLITMDKQNAKYLPSKKCDIYFAAMDDEA